MNTGEKIKMLRIQKELSQEELGKLIGVKKAAIYKYENGIVINLKRSTIAKLAKALDTTPAFLMGWGEKDPNIIYPQHFYKIPVVGIIRAGQPILAAENIEGYELTDVINPQEYYYLRATGDSMIDAGIKEGSLVLMKKQDCAEDGQIVACLTDGENATLKRFRRKGDTVVLMPENRAYQPIILSCKDFDNGFAKILGVAERVVIKL